MPEATRSTNRLRVSVLPSPTGGAVVEVSDNGIGVAPEHVARIFDPFFTTKFTGRGLGLAAVLGIVRAHRGAIRVASAPGRGTTIRVLMPTSGGPAVEPEAAAEAVLAAHAPDEGGSVLIVDDEETVRTVAKRILTGKGFTVRLASGGVEALHVLREDPSAIDVVLLDMTMPDMSGMVTMQELLRIRPDIHIVLSSGYTQEEALPVGDLSAAATAFIQKPYRPADLVATIRRALA
jgi:CheY-like chemotaxis protein